MGMQNMTSNKPNAPKLEQILPEGLVVDRKWLYAQGYDRSTVDYFLRSGRLERVERGVYRRPGPPLKWQHRVYSLQKMGIELHVGGRSALDLQGYAHYLEAGRSKKTISLYGKGKLPAWLDDRFVAYKEKCFKQLPEDALTTLAFGHWDWEIAISTVELALLELVGDIKEAADFKVADRYFESVTVLNIQRMNRLLEKCTHIRSKRLFLWFAQKHGHQWFDALHKETIDLGKGKREIVKGGVLDRNYLITVPREMVNDAIDFF